MKYEVTQPRRRAGFTLIEVMVVIAIIAVLASLLAGAVFKILASQSQKRTEATVKKLQTGLSGQWQAVIDSVKDELKSTGGQTNNALYWKAETLALTAPGPTVDRALMRPIYLKLRLAQEFPMSFAEALNPGGTGAPKSTYKTALTGAVITPAIVLTIDPSGNLNAAQLESAICLHLALNQGRRGQTFNAEDVGAGSVKSIALGPTGSLSYFADAWGQPITFERWTNDAALLTELSAPPYAPATGSADKDDPDGTLYVQKGGWTQAYVTQTVLPVLGQQITLGSPQNHGPIIRSFGPNKKFGDGDDILGFRLMKEGSRGSN